MILFKRVGESFRSIEGREWALLFLETLGVVAGILIAFELNEWASRRAEAKRGHALLERLFEESRDTVSSLRYDRDRVNKIVSNEEDFAVVLLNEDRCPPETMWGAVDTLPMYPAISVPSTVYQEIMGSGGLSSIEDSRVRYAVSSFRAELEWVQGQNQHFREYARQEYPVSYSDPRVEFGFNRSLDEAHPSHFDRKAFCKDRAFRNGIADTVLSHQKLANMDNELTQFAVNMCVAIGLSLGETCQPSFGGPLKGDDAKFAADVLAKMRKDLAKS